MSDSTCKICGGPVPSGMRYCDDCDFQARRSGAGTPDEPRRKEPVAYRERGSLSMFLLVFLVASVGTVGMGVTATPGLSLPGLRDTLGIGGAAAPAMADWGEIRLVNTRVRIRAARNTNSEIVGMLETGDRVRAHFLQDNWYAVFDTGTLAEDPSQAIGYVYAPLLKPLPGSEERASRS